MIQMICDLPLTPSSRKRLEKQVAKDMKETGETGRSSSGTTAIMAIAWCEKHNYVWQLTGSHRAGYHVKRIGEPFNGP